MTNFTENEREEAVGRLTTAFGEEGLNLAPGIEKFAAAIGRSFSGVVSDLIIAVNRPLLKIKSDPLSIPYKRWEYQQTVLAIVFYPLYALFVMSILRENPDSFRTLVEYAQELEKDIEW